MGIITIDTGTTNTRVRVWAGTRLSAEICSEVGVRDTAITGSRIKLQQGVKDAIERAQKAAEMSNGDIDLILASGMISSNVGLLEVPHVLAPAGVEDLAAGMREAVISEVSPRPIWFIPGIKNRVDRVTVDNCDLMDIMRGEEVETFGAIEMLNLKGPALFALPGSHSKFISVDAGNRITSCITTLAGELLGTITTNTILANALNTSFATEVEPNMFLQGADHALRVGLNRTCFLVRILDQFSHYQTDEKASFLLGAVLATDLLALKNSNTFRVGAETTVVIMGKKILKNGFELLLKHDGFFKGTMIVVDEAAYRECASIGAIAAARSRGLTRERLYHVAGG